jgi:hypothetical protein
MNVPVSRSYGVAVEESRMRMVAELAAERAANITTAAARAAAAAEARPSPSSADKLINLLINDH